jgi:hypothetical protein
MTLTQPLVKRLLKPHCGLMQTIIQPRSQQYPFSYSAQYIYASEREFTHQLFEIWQDLSLEATGSDTVWGYPVPLMQVVTSLGMSEPNLISQIAQTEIPYCEYAESQNTIAFHAPISQ